MMPLILSEAMVMCASTHHHRFAHDAPHLAWFEVAEEDRHPVLHLRLRDELDQAGYDGARLLLPDVNLLHIERVCIRVLFGRPYVTNPKVKSTNINWRFVFNCCLLRGFFSFGLFLFLWSIFFFLFFRSRRF